MAALKKLSPVYGNGVIDETLFGLIAQDIEQQGYSIRPTALPTELTNQLFIHQQTMEAEKFKDAGIGRGDEYSKMSLSVLTKYVGLLVKVMQASNG